MAFSAVTITVFHDFKNFDFCIDVFDINSFTGNTFVFRFFFSSKLTASRFFLWSFTVEVVRRDSLITTVRLCLYCTQHTMSHTIFIQLEIMCFSHILCNTQNFHIRFSYDHLCFYCVSFLFSGIPFFLFFLGRSTGHSVTSTRTTSIL